MPRDAIFLDVEHSLGHTKGRNAASQVIAGRYEMHMLENVSKKVTVTVSDNVKGPGRL